MKRFFALLLAVLTVLCFTSCDYDDFVFDDEYETESSESSDRPYAEIPHEEPCTPSYFGKDVLFAYGSPEIDGAKDECWSEAFPITLDILLKDTPEAEVTAYQMWDEERLYFLFEITDAEISQNEDVGDWHNDGIYMFISETCSLDASYLYSDYPKYEGLYQFAVINETLSMIPRHGAQDFTENDYDCKVCFTETGMTVEFSYSPKHIKLQADQYLLIDYQYNDCNSDGARIGCLSAFRTKDTCPPADFGIGVLVEKDANVSAYYPR